MRNVRTFYNRKSPTGSKADWLTSRKSAEKMGVATMGKWRCGRKYGTPAKQDVIK
jgi:hypothetical protein